MKLTRRQISTVLSIVWLLAMTILAAYALRTTNTYNLPIPNSLSALTLALPPIAGLVLETSNQMATALATSPKYTKSHPKRTIPPVLLPSTLSILALLVYQTVIATLAGTHISPSGSLKCALREKWTAMFRAKDGDSISQIQNLLSCCGFQTARDMAFPFPDKTHKADTCELRFERHTGCLEAWRDKERLVSGLMMAVTVGVFVWMVVIVATPAVHPIAVRKVLQSSGFVEDVDDVEDGRGNDTPRRIEYARYRDDPEAETPVGDETSVRREINALNNQSNLASLVEGQRMHPSVLINDSNKWREPNGN